MTCQFLIFPYRIPKDASSVIKYGNLNKIKTIRHARFAAWLKSCNIAMSSNIRILLQG